MDPIEVTFQDGDRSLRIRVPLPPVQLWGRRGYWIHVDQALNSAAKLIWHTPLITYRQPSGYDGEGDDTTA